MHPPRFRTRTLMVAVAAMAVFFALSTGAVRRWTDPALWAKSYLDAANEVDWSVEMAESAGDSRSKARYERKAVHYRERASKLKRLSEGLKNLW